MGIEENKYIKDLDVNIKACFRWFQYSGRDLEFYGPSAPILTHSFIIGNRLTRKNDCIVNRLTKSEKSEEFIADISIKCSSYYLRKQIIHGFKDFVRCTINGDTEVSSHVELIGLSFKKIDC